MADQKPILPTNNPPALERSEISTFKSPLEKIESFPENTLDEPIMTTISREFKSMCYKFGYVLLPRSEPEHKRKLRSWDLWGPFFICLILGLVLANANQFILLTLTIFLGALFVTFNLRVLGGKVSFLQSISILGYCTFPLFVVTLLIKLLQFLRFRNRLVTVIAVAVGVVWCLLAARAFVGSNVPEGRKFIAMYPIFLFYIFLGTFVIYM